MGLLNREDLKYDYTWTSNPGKSPATDPGPASRGFSTGNGRDVLEFINSYADRKNIENKKDALRIEKMLHDDLDEEMKTRKEVTTWLDSRY